MDLFLLRIGKLGNHRLLMVVSSRAKAVDKMEIMRNRDRAYSIFHLVLVLAVFGVSCAFACGCDFTNDVDGEFDTAAYVFLARIVDVDVLRSGKFEGDGEFDEIFRIRARVEVVQTYKGDTSTVEFVVSESSPSACGLPMLKDDEYIFFANDLLSAGLCSASLSKRTAPAYGIDWNEYRSRVEATASNALKGDDH